MNLGRDDDVENKTPNTVRGTVSCRCREHVGNVGKEARLCRCVGILFLKEIYHFQTGNFWHRCQQSEMREMEKSEMYANRYTLYQFAIL